MSEDFRAQAEAALAAGDAAQAAEALGRGLWQQPDDAALCALADRLAPQADIDQLLPMGLGMKVHAGALRARLLAAQGQLDEATQLLLQVAPVDPQVAYLPWALAWLEAPGAAERLDVDALLSTLAGVQASLEQGGPARASQWGHIAALLKRLLAAHPVHPHLSSMLALSLRNAGEHAEAVRFAEAAYAADPSFFTAVALAGTLRVVGDLDAAVDAYERAQRHAPEQPGPSLDIADLLTEAGRHRAALDRYTAILGRHPDHPWATASSHYLRFQLGERSARIDLLRDWIAQPGHPRARQLARLSSPWVGYLPEPWEALVSYAQRMTPQEVASLRNQALAQLPPGATPEALQHSLSMARPEAPSAQLVARRALDGSGVSLRVSVEGVPQPDPRAPRAADLRWTLWSFDGADATPALPPPDAPDLEGLVADIAARQDDLDFAAHAGRWLGSRCAPSVIGALLALMVHPPPAPEGMPLWSWLPRVQRACACAIAAVGEGWEGSARREALRALILGTSDWTVAAGAWAAVALAEHDETGAIETLDWILTRLRDEPIDVFCGQTYPLALAALLHPAMSAEGRRSLLGLIERAESLLAR